MLGLYDEPLVAIENVRTLRERLDCEYIHIGRPFVLQNVFRITPARGRTQVIELHRQMLKTELLDKNNPRRKLLARCARKASKGQKIRFLCFCKPKKCHGDLYVRIIKLRMSGMKWSRIAKLI